MLRALPEDRLDYRPHERSPSAAQIAWTLTSVAMEQPVGDLLWLFLLDGIHHRGQLSTYIRPMGGKVPSIYGPSGDEPAK